MSAECLRAAGINVRLLGCGKTVSIRSYPTNRPSVIEMNKNAFGELIDELSRMYASMEGRK